MIERSAAYLDASAIVKLVVDEPDSAALLAFLESRPRCVTSRVAEVEVRRAVARFGGPIEPDRVDGVLSTVAMIELDASLARAAGRLSPPLLRTLDAIHLATALELASDLDVFVTYDRRLADAATSVGIPVAWPRSEASSGHRVDPSTAPPADADVRDQGLP